LLKCQKEFFLAGDGESDNVLTHKHLIKIPDSRNLQLQAARVANSWMVTGLGILDVAPDFRGETPFSSVCTNAI
jgi:hypothetical protein